MEVVVLTTADDLLKIGTGKGVVWWCNFIGQHIANHSHSIKGQVHDITYPSLWLRDLTDEVCKKAESRHNPKYDGNIICSSLLSLILSAWSCRVRRAKSYDPRRPIRLRKKMLQGTEQYHKALLECMTDESMDHILFPKQKWDPPFAPGAKDGTYV